MKTKDVIKDIVYWEALLALCEEKNLNKITVNDVVEKAGTARQTFYSRFRDVNDMISYYPIRNVERGFALEEDRREALGRIYSYALEHKVFFSQLPSHTCQNNFHDTFLTYCIERNSKEAYLSKEGGDPTEKQLSVYFYSAGSVALLLEWCRRGMDIPYRKLINTMIDARPSFLNE